MTLKKVKNQPFCAIYLPQTQKFFRMMEITINSIIKNNSQALPLTHSDLSKTMKNDQFKLMSKVQVVFLKRELCTQIWFVIQFLKWPNSPHFYTVGQTHWEDLWHHWEFSQIKLTILTIHIYQWLHYIANCTHWHL